jgi:RNA polymerase sigma factor (sigma-70 family)
MQLRAVRPNPAGLAIVPEPGSATLRRPRAKESLDPIELERFERSLLPHMRAAYNLARWLTRSDHDAEDVVQEAYLRAFRFFGGFRGGDAKAWLLTIVRHTSYSAWRRVGEAGTTVPLDEDTPEVEDGAPGPEDLLLQKASGQEVREALAALPVEFREVVVLRELEGLSYKEMAEVTQLPIGTVMSRLARARARLRRGLQERLRGGPP